MTTEDLIADLNKKVESLEKDNEILKGLLEEYSPLKGESPLNKSLPKNDTTHLDCECRNWAGRLSGLNTEHTSECPKRTIRYIEMEAKKHLVKILGYFRDYCNEGDGVPLEFWEGYKRALWFAGEFKEFSECLEWESDNMSEEEILMGKKYD